MSDSNSSGGSLVLLVIIAIIIGAGVLGAHSYHLQRDYTQLNKEYQATSKALDTARQQAEEATARLAAAQTKAKQLKDQVSALTEELQATKGQLDQQSSLTEQLRAENESLRSQASYHGQAPLPQTQPAASTASPSTSIAASIPIPNTGQAPATVQLPVRWNPTAVMGMLAGTVLVFGSVLLIRRQSKNHLGRARKKISLELTPEQLQDFIHYRRQSSGGRTRPVRING